MKITKSQLKEIIKEEIEAVLEDSAGWPRPGTSDDIYKGAPCLQATREHGTQKFYKGDEGYEECVEKKRVQESSLEEKDDWIQKAVDPKHKGYCTPMTKSTCTPKRKALAKRFKKAGRKEKEQGGTGWQGKV